MRLFNTLILCLLGIILPLSASPTLILFFDLNGTLIAQDRATKSSVEEGLNRALAAHTFDCWDDRVKEPISYAEFIRTLAIPDSPSTQQKAKQNRAMGAFLSFLRRTHHPAKEAVEARFDKLYQKLQCGKQLLFPSFYQLIAALNSRHMRYTIILRTFGTDLPAVLKEIEQRLGKDFICCKGSFKKGVFYTQEQPIEDLQLLYAFFQQGNMAVQDDHTWWTSHDRTEAYGKPFPLDLENPSTLALFFDDHLADSTIIHPIDIHTGQSLSLPPLIEKGYAVAVDTLQALEEDDYFLRLVNQALQKQANTLKLAPQSSKDESPCSDEPLKRLQNI
jgi:hypothetical protein